MVAVILAKATGAVTRGHKERAPLRVKVRLAHYLYHVAGGEYRGVALSARGIAASELEGLVIGHWYDFCVNAACLKGCGERM